MALQLVHHRGMKANQLVPMPQHLPQVSLRRRRHPDPGKTVREQQVENMQGIARVRLLLPHHGCTDLRFSDPEFVIMFSQQVSRFGSSAGLGNWRGSRRGDACGPGIFGIVLRRYSASFGELLGLPARSPVGGTHGRKKKGRRSETAAPLGSSTLRPHIFRSGGATEPEENQLRGSQ